MASRYFVWVAHTGKKVFSLFFFPVQQVLSTPLPVDWLLRNTIRILSMRFLWSWKFCEILPISQIYRWKFFILYTIFLFNVFTFKQLTLRDAEGEDTSLVMVKRIDSSIRRIEMKKILLWNPWYVKFATSQISYRPTVAIKIYFQVRGLRVCIRRWLFFPLWYWILKLIFLFLFKLILCLKYSWL